MDKILIVEDSKSIAKSVSDRISTDLKITCEVAYSMVEARQLIELEQGKFWLAVLDLILPDAPNGEIVDYIISQKIPAIVLTGEFSNDIREYIISKKVVDYIIKESPQTLDHLVSLLCRLQKNSATQVLVVDDSQTTRTFIKRLLQIQRFEVFEAQDGLDALELIKKHPKIKLVITDYNMPKMDGFQLTTEIRKKYPIERLAVIGVSASGSSVLSAKFLKKGANDFVIKPFSEEEFLWRITQNIQMQDYIDSLRQAAIRDYLTNLYNRRYFYEVGQKLFANAKHHNLSLIVAMIDIDHFKHVNDRFGHQNGDLVLKQMAKVLQEHFRASDVIARYGGEEFCILVTNLRQEECQSHFECLRENIENLRIQTAQYSIGFTVSIGITTKLLDNLEKTINQADQLLYRAKQEGRNRVVME